MVQVFIESLCGEFPNSAKNGKRMDPKLFVAGATMASSHPKKNVCKSDPLYWLFNNDPYNGLRTIIPT